MTRTLHVAVAQIHSGGPIKETLERVERQVAAAAVVGAELIPFSEGALHGYDYDMTPESVRAVAEPVDGSNCRRITGMARQHGITARKHVLTPGELAAGLTPGAREREIVEINGVRCALIS